jgi:hypothetical protein
MLAGGAPRMRHHGSHLSDGTTHRFRYSSHESSHGMAGTLMLTSVGFALFRLAPHATVGVSPGLDGYAMAAASSAGVLCNGRV